MLVIKCAKCKAKIFKYRKIGKGRVLRCWKKRIVEDYADWDGAKVKCSKCGATIGNADNLKVRMKQSAFTSSGTYE